MHLDSLLNTSPSPNALGSSMRRSNKASISSWNLTPILILTLVLPAAHYSVAQEDLRVRAGWGVGWGQELGTVVEVAVWVRGIQASLCGQHGPRRVTTIISSRGAAYWACY